MRLFTSSATKGIEHESVGMMPTCHSFAFIALSSLINLRIASNLSDTVMSRDFPRSLSVDVPNRTNLGSYSYCATISINTVGSQIDNTSISFDRICLDNSYAFARDIIEHDY